MKGRAESIIPLAIAVAALILVLCGADRLYGATISAEASYTPWSGYWWPMKSGKLVFGYRGNPSPLEKYDLYVSGRYPDEATQWEEDNNYHPDGESWWGYCHAWANAAVLEVIDFTPSVHDGIFFAVGDKKGLITVCHDDDPTVIFHCDDDPSLFHLFLVQYIGEGGVPIIADLASSGEVWSYPVYRYEMDITEEAGHDDIMCSIRYADDFVDPDYEGTKELGGTYYYRLYKDGDGNYTYGEWTESSVSGHPEYVWIPVSQQADNPYLNYGAVREIAVSRDDETEGMTELVPGHYPLVVYPGEEDSFEIQAAAQAGIEVSLAIDPQGPQSSSASYEISRDGERLASGEISDVLQSVTLTGGDDADYQLVVLPAEDNESSVFVRLYVDIIFAENRYLLNIPANYWLGMGLANHTAEESNPFFVTYLTEEGLPLGSAHPGDRISGFGNWVGYPDMDLPYDYFSSGEPRLMRVTSEYPLNILELVGNENTLYGPPGPKEREVTGPQELVVPLLTESLDVQRSSRLFLYNSGSEEFSCQINYFGDNGEDEGEYAWDIPARVFESHYSGQYPGDMNLSGWSILSDPSGGLVGKVEIRETALRMDELPLLRAGGPDLYFPHVASMNGMATWLTLFNVLDVWADVTLFLAGGAEEDAVAVISLAPHEKRELAMDASLFGISDDAVNDSWLRVDAPYSVAGFVSYRYKDVSVVSFPLFEEELFSTYKTICHVASNEWWWTGIALMNREPGPVAVDFTGYDEEGNQVADTSRIIEAERKLTEMAALLFPGQQDLVKSIRIDAARPVIGLVLYGAVDDISLLSGKALE